MACVEKRLSQQRLASQTDNLLVWSTAVNVTILRTKRLNPLAMNPSQFLI